MTLKSRTLKRLPASIVMSTVVRVNMHRQSAAQMGSWFVLFAFHAMRSPLTHISLRLQPYEDWRPLEIPS